MCVKLIISPRARQLFHGDNDFNVSVAESKAMNKALTDLLLKSYEFLTGSMSTR